LFTRGVCGCSCGRCMWIRHRSVYQRQFPNLREQPNPAASWGLGCHDCAIVVAAGHMPGTVWSRYEYRGSFFQHQDSRQTRIQIEDIKRHFNQSSSQGQGKVPRDKHHDAARAFIKPAAAQIGGPSKPLSSVRDDISALAPHETQIALAYEIGYNMHGLMHYPERCEAERARGGLIPHTRTSEEVGK
jgi:hypothetical protein